MSLVAAHIPIFSAWFCVLSRSILTVVDRKLFAYEEGSFATKLVLNTYCPLAFAITFALLYGDYTHYFWFYVFSPGVILSGLCSQFSALSFSAAFKEMSIKDVALANKLTDVLIPLFHYFYLGRFVAHEYVFTLATTVIFIILMFKETSFSSKFAVYTPFIVLSTLLQAVVNQVFCVADTIPDLKAFLVFMPCVLFWRCVAVTIPYSWKTEKLQLNSFRQFTSYHVIFMRAGLGFLAQAAFFYSITRGKSTVTWAVLNSTILFACAAGHLFLKERLSPKIFAALIVFVALSLLFGSM
ncbi:MAG: hypothetical protein K0S74_79 [Chlamydiales bacterium]|jgi:drug/metabolite transporter (DMT)-like permease|nr:hypothetical protein [Chlamydiales bacterium]